MINQHDAVSGLNIIAGPDAPERIFDRGEGNAEVMSG
jgi:hypothetical protein